MPRRRNRSEETRAAGTRAATARSSFDPQTEGIYYIDPAIVPKDEYWYWATTEVRNMPATAHMATVAAAGYRPVPADKYPELAGATLLPTANPHNVITRGPSILVSIPKHKYQQIVRRRQERTQAQMQAVAIGLESAGNAPPIEVEANERSREHVLVQRRQAANAEQFKE